MIARYVSARGLMNRLGPIAFALCCALLSAKSLGAQNLVDFAREVRPILSDRCFICHGPDAAKREAGLRLDQRPGALQQLASGHTPIVPGKPDQSELLRRLTAHDAEQRMPPADSKLTVSADEIRVLRQWISEGAAYTVHWSFMPVPEKVALPKVREKQWASNELDLFVLAKMEEQGMAPSPPALAEAYLRRLSLVLNGLPPTKAQIEQFVMDGDATRAVDEMLQSTRYGERMASDWLDVARYADTYGYQNDVERPVWPWRDWVVRSFNENLSYADFAMWQIAGDLLPDATLDQQMATAFQRLHRQTNEGGSIEEEMRLEYVADRTETFSTAFLGMTIGCARCHDHKFDPVTQREYYELSAFFDNIDESGLYSHFTRATPTPALSLATDAQSKAEVVAASKVRELEGRLSSLRLERFSAFQTWLEQSSEDDAWLPVGVGRFQFESMESGVVANEANKAKPGKVGDSPQLVSGFGAGKAIQFDGEDWAKFPGVADFDRHQPFSMAFWLRIPEAYDRAVVLHRSMAWTDAGSRGYELLIEDGELSFALVHFWPGNAIRVRTHDSFPIDQWAHVGLTYDGSSRASGMKVYVNGHAMPVDVVRDQLTRTIRGGGADALTLAQRFRDRGLKGGSIDDLRVFDVELTSYEVESLVQKEMPPPSKAEGIAIYLRDIDESYRAQAAELVVARRALGKQRDLQTEIMVMRDMATQRATYVRPRGSYLMKGDRVDPGTPACLPPLSKTPRNRLALAQWLLDPAHPLTARVAVNRIWQMYFGTGLVASAEDFGSQGSSPTHPKLLDWLARMFMDSGWDMKALHRLIATSATFRQSSSVSPKIRDMDPENRLLARGPRFQLPAEVLRDQVLWASGLLVEKVGGPPVRPYQPPGLWQEKSGAVYHPTKGEGLYRRSLYTYWKRTSPPPAMMLLDASKRDVCVMRRQSTTTPLQALLMLNDPQYVEAARVWAERVTTAGGDDLKRLGAVFSRLTSRAADAQELAILNAALVEQRELYGADIERAKQTAAIGDREPVADIDVVEVAAWTIVISMLMNFDEVVRQR